MSFPRLGGYSVLRSVEHGACLISARHHTTPSADFEGEISLLDRRDVFRYSPSLVILLLFYHGRRKVPLSIAARLMCVCFEKAGHSMILI